jgi:hypothetical protein
MNEIINAGYGYGGMLTVDCATQRRAETFMRILQNEKRSAILPYHWGILIPLCPAPVHRLRRKFHPRIKPKWDFHLALSESPSGSPDRFRTAYGSWKWPFSTLDL